MGKKKNKGKNEALSKYEFAKPIGDLSILGQFFNPNYQNGNDEYIWSVKDIENERDMLLAIVVNTMPERFKKIRYLIDDKGSKEDLLVTRDYFYLQFETKSGSIALSVTNTMWFDFGCDEISKNAKDHRRVTVAYRKLMIKELLEMCKQEMTARSYKCNPTATESLQTSEVFFDEDDDDEKVPFKDDGSNDDKIDDPNDKSKYCLKIDDDDDDDDD